MEKQKKHIVVLVYYSLKDPLCEGLMLSYLRALREDQVMFHLITYEQKKFAITEQETEALQKKLLKENNIKWYPMRYTSGRFFIIKKALSALQGITLIRSIHNKNRLSLICGMATLAGTFAYLASRLTGVKYGQFTYEPHSLIMMESGRMSSKSFRFRIARYFEKKIGLTAEFVACTTKHMVDDLKKQGAKGRLYRIPTSVDEDVNRFSDEARARIRTSLGIDQQPLLIYPGKFGGMYRQHETIHLLTAWTKLYPEGHVLIITDFDLDIIDVWMKEFGSDPERFHVMSAVSLQKIPEYLSAADLGLIAYENFDSRKYCSPVKTGEYLMCGVPYLVQKGTSEDDEMAITHRVGAVMETFDPASLANCKPIMDNLLRENKSALRNRCREVGELYRGKRNALKLMKEIFSSC